MCVATIVLACVVQTANHLINRIVYRSTLEHVVWKTQNVLKKMEIKGIDICGGV